MKRRPPPSFTRVTKPSKRSAVPSAAAPPRRAAPDRKIRAWSADNHERREEEQFNRRPTAEQQVEAESWWLARFQRPNDQEIAQRIARQGVGRDLTEASMSHMQVIEDPRDPRVILRPHRGLWSRLKQGLSMQYSASKLILTDAKAPTKWNWAAYIRDLRKDTKG
jgi:hypothetical protein